MTSTTTLPARISWRLMNLIHGVMFLREPRTVPDVLRDGDADLGDLIVLESAGWLRATTGQRRGIRTAVSLTTPGLDVADVEVTLTPAGLHWCELNPFNRAVWAAATHGAQSPAPLHRIGAFVDVDPAVLVAVFDAGLVAITAAREFGSAGITVAELRRPDLSWLIRVTPAGRYVLAA